MIGSLVIAAAVAASQPSKVDLAGIDQAIRGVYEVISGPPGQKRDFDRMRAMFAPGAMLKAIGPKGLRGGSLEDYISRNSAILEKEGFTERELGRRVEAWGGLATAWSAYDGRTANGSFMSEASTASSWSRSMESGWSPPSSGRRERLKIRCPPTWSRD